MNDFVPASSGWGAGYYLERATGGCHIYLSEDIYKKKTYKTTLWTINTLETETNMAYLAFALDGDDYSYSVWP